MNVEEIMSKVQEFASTWAVVDGRFDDGTAMERAEQCKAEIRTMLAGCAALDGTFISEGTKIREGGAVLDEQKAGPSDLEIVALWHKIHEPFGGADFKLSHYDFARALLSKYAAPVNEQDAKDAQRYRDLLCRVVDQLDRGNDSRNAPGHGHSRPGIWDDDNGELAGKPCAWCALWNEAKSVRAAIAQQGKGE